MGDRSNSIAIECVTGDISNQPDVDAVVNAANAELMPGGGVAGAIHRAAGPGLAEECRPMAPIRPGEAVLSGAQNLPNEWVIHCLGPVYGLDKPAEGLLAACYDNALRLAEEKGIASLAFPAISTGAFGYPPEPAAEVCAEAVKRVLPHLERVRLIRFVLFDDGDRQVMQRAFADAGLINP